MLLPGTCEGKASKNFSSRLLVIPRSAPRARTKARSTQAPAWSVPVRLFALGHQKGSLNSQRALRAKCWISLRKRPFLAPHSLAQRSDLAPTRDQFRAFANRSRARLESLSAYFAAAFLPTSVASLRTGSLFAAFSFICCAEISSPIRSRFFMAVMIEAYASLAGWMYFGPWIHRNRAIWAKHPERSIRKTSYEPGSNLVIGDDPEAEGLHVDESNVGCDSVGNYHQFGTSYGRTERHLESCTLDGCSRCHA